MPLFLATPVKVAAVVLGVGAAGAGGYVVYDAFRPEPLPLLPVADTAYFGPAPAVDELPFYGPAPVGYLRDRGDAYAWAERAYATNYAFADYPPDYAYFYDDIEYWVWASGDHWLLEIEPLRIGYRRYYYAPYYDDPYFILDAGWGYGFDRGVLVLVIDPSGRVMDPDFVRARSDWAGRYLLRARQLRRARLEAAREDRLWRIDEDRWLGRRDRLLRDQARLERAALTQDDWRAYRDRSGLQEQRFFAAERRRRDARLQDAGWRDRLGDRARRSGDAPPAVTVAERRRRPADELVRRADDRATTRAFARADQRTDRLEAREAARRTANAERADARDSRRQAYRDIQAERRAAAPTREGRAAARDQALSDRRAARVERQQAYRDIRERRREAFQATQGRPERAAARVERRMDAPRAERAPRADRAERAQRPRRDEAVERERPGRGGGR